MTSWLALALVLATEESAAKSSLAITDAALSEGGMLAIGIEFSSAEEKRMYAWRDGGLQPALNWFVFVDVRDHRRRLVRVEYMPQALPEDPLVPSYFKSGRRISYEEPIRVVARDPRRKLKGCYEVRVRYDSRRVEAKHRRQVGLDEIRAASPAVRVCSQVKRR